MSQVRLHSFEDESQWAGNLYLSKLPAFTLIREKTIFVFVSVQSPAESSDLIHPGLIDPEEIPDPGPG